MQFETFVAEFHDVPGFTIPESLGIWDCFLRFQLEKERSASLLEIGVYYGKSAALLAMHSRPDEQLVLVDPSEPAESALKLLQSIKPNGVRLLKNLSSDHAVWNLAGTHSRAFRWIHIDGDHKGETVYNDLLLANELLSPTGIICVDDFMSPRYPQITFTVCTFVELFCRELRMFLCGFNKAYLVRPESLFTHLTFVKTSSETNKAFLGSIILPFIKQTIRILLTASASRLAGKITSTLDSMKIRRKFQFERNESHLLA